MKQTRGFTLLEMMVATVIMAVAVVGLLAGISGAMRNAARLTEHDRAAQLARLRMNELLVDQRFPRDSYVEGGFNPQESGGLSAGWRARLSNYLMPPTVAAGETALDRIELEVWWMAGGQRRSFNLEAYRPRVLKVEDIAPQARLAQP